MEKAIFIYQLDSKTQKGIQAATEKYFTDVFPELSQAEIDRNKSDILREEISVLYEWEFMTYLDSDTFNTIVNL